MAGSAPSPWTPPAHWPPMPAGVSPDALAHWIASNRQSDEIKAQTDQLRAAANASIAHAEAMDVFTDAQVALAVFQACAPTPMTEAAIRSRAEKLVREFRKLYPPMAG